MTSPGLAAFKLAFEISPIILTRGIADLISFGMLPIVAITEGIDFAAGLLSGTGTKSLDDFFAHFIPAAGGTLIQQQIGTYPFANQAVAANAVIAMPTNISMLMVCPARGQGGFAIKLATMMMLQGVLDKHNNSGGTYTVVTPSYIYDDCLMVAMVDVSGGRGKQAQTEYRLDFAKPLITQKSAQAAKDSLTSKLAAALPTDGSRSAVGGLSPFPGLSIPSLFGTNVAGPAGGPNP